MKTIINKTLSGIAAAAALGLALSGCAAPADGAPEDDRPTVVASTSVYADLARQIGGDRIRVEAIVDSPAQDPHSYEATPLDRLTVQDADLLIVNGGGYDSFMDQMIEASAEAAEPGAARVPVLDAVEISGLQDDDDHHAADHDHADHDEHADHADHREHAEEDAEAAHESGTDAHAGHDHSAFNEHVWYDLPAMMSLSREIADQLAELDPAGEQGYRQRAEELERQLGDLQDRVEPLELSGELLATEPVADRLLESAGLHDATPEEATAAVESGTDLTPLLYLDLTEMLEDGEVDVLAYNEHTAGGQTERLRELAEESGVHVLAFTETMPAGQSYQEWMGDAVSELEELADAGLADEGEQR